MRDIYNLVLVGCIISSSLFIMAFTSESVVVAKVVGTSTPHPIAIAVKSHKMFATTSAVIDSIILVETSPNTFAPGTIVDFILSSGFEWDESNTDPT